MTRDLVARAGRDPSTPSAVIASASTPRQRVVTSTLAEVAREAREVGIGAPAILVVGDVVTLRERLRWFDVGPLFGKRVLVPRPRAQAREAIELLAEHGAEAIAIPTIAIQPVDPASLAPTIASLRTYDAIAFTSANAVDAFRRALDGAGKDARALGDAKVASVGAATTRALAAFGVRADLATDGGADALGHALVGAIPPGSRVLFPRAAAGREALFEVLGAAGIHVDGVTVYETRAAAGADREALNAALDEGIDAVLATSPSTLEHLVSAVGAAQLEGVAIACIGDTTAAAARALGLEVALIAETSTVPALIEALARSYSTSAPGALHVAAHPAGARTSKVP